jgi:hypothetical protein
MKAATVVLRDEGARIAFNGQIISVEVPRSTAAALLTNPGSSRQPTHNRQQKRGKD